VRIEICPTVRDADGLALSSRNALLSDDERRRATALHRALSAVRGAVCDGVGEPSSALADGRAVLAEAGVDVEYLSLVDPETMEPLRELRGDALAVVAARVGSTRLIDNALITETRTIDNEVATRLRAPTA
jgi:pantoate--beta-alanine ligase